MSDQNNSPMQLSALTLSGGSVKGAFQSGAIKAVIEKGFHPDHIYGISVGSLNSTFINHEAGKQGLPANDLDWNRITDNLIKFWQEQVRKPSDLVKKHSVLKSIFSAVTGNFNGLVSNNPLRNMVYWNIDPVILSRSRLRHYVGTVNLFSGEITYADPSFPGFLDYVIASTAMPVIMPGMQIKSDHDQTYFDGGLRDVAPLKKAIRNGASQVVCILCQAKSISCKPFNHKNIIRLSERVIDIMTDEIERNDISQAEKINRFVPADGTPAADGPFKGKRKVNIWVIRPPEQINIDITKFGHDDISQMIDLGYRSASEVLKNVSFRPTAPLM
jgi:NTE family protein